MDGCSFPISIVHRGSAGQRDGVVCALHAISLSLSVNGGLQAVATEVVIILGFDLLAIDLAECDVGLHLFARIVETHRAFGFAVLLGNRQPELAARSRRTAPASGKVTSDCVIRK